MTAASTLATPTTADALRAMLGTIRHRLFVVVPEEALARCDEPPKPTEDGDDAVRLLGDLVARSRGSVVVFSDRPLSEVDRLLAPLELPGCGCGGLETRTTDGRTTRRRFSADLDPVRRLLEARGEALRDHEIRDEGLTIVLAHAADVESGNEVRAIVREAVALAPAVFRARFDRTEARISFVCESRASALARLLDDEQYLERIPLLIGAPPNEPDLIGVVRSFGGSAIAVGTASAGVGDVSLPGTNDVRWLLREFLARLDEDAE